MAEEIIAVGNGFWNIRGDLRIAGVLNIGTQCSLVKLGEGRFVFLDSYTFTSHELVRMYRLWGYIGRLLGIDPRFVSGITTHAAARRMSELLDAVTGPLTAQR